MLFLLSVNVIVEIDIIQWNSTIIFYHIYYVLNMFVCILPHGDGVPPKHVAEIKNLYLYVSCKCRYCF